jgi:hypothetical protein
LLWCCVEGLNSPNTFGPNGFSIGDILNIMGLAAIRLS